MIARDMIALALPLSVLLGAGLILVADLFLPESARRRLGWVACATVLGAFIASFVVPAGGSAFSGAFESDAWTTFLSRVLLAATFPCLLGAMDFVATTWSRRAAEYHVLVLFSLSGMLLLAGARDLVLLAVAFELMGVPLYILAAYGKTEGASRTRAAEAGLKLYLVGAASSALTLFGLSFVTGLAGGTSLTALAATPPSPLLAVGLMLTLAGMAFKIGAAPFHAWVPDTYEGAATPFIAFLSTAPKAAGFAALVSVLVVGAPGEMRAWLPAVLAISVVTLIAGNLLAIPQTSVKRVLAYSGVAQVGYVLIALAAGPTALGSLLFYLAAYVVANVGVFLVAHAVESSEGDASIAGLDGLARRSPWLGLALLMFLLSLAGIPFVAGFWAKLYVFMAAWNAGLGWLVFVGALFATVALFYYLGLAKAAYASEPRHAGKVRVGAPLTVAIIACLLGVVLMGVWPRPILEAAELAAHALMSR